MLLVHRFKTTYLCIAGLSRFELLTAFLGTVAGRRQRGAAPREGSAGTLTARQGSGMFFYYFYTMLHYERYNIIGFFIKMKVN